MKLMVAIIQDEHINQVIKDLMASKYRTTKLSSTGGFLKSGSTTLLIGVKEKEVDQVIRVIEKSCQVRKSGREDKATSSATIFVLNMEDHKRL